MRPTLLLVIFLSIAALASMLVIKHLDREPGPGTKYAHSKNELVYYSGEATEVDARAVGVALAEAGHFDGAKPRDVLVHRADSTFVLSIVVSPGKEREDWAEGESRKIGRRVARAVGARTMNVRLVDEMLRTKREFVID